MSVRIVERGGEGSRGVRAHRCAGDRAERRRRRVFLRVDFGRRDSGRVGSDVAEGVAEAFVERIRFENLRFVFPAGFSSAGETFTQLRDSVTHLSKHR